MMYSVSTGSTSHQQHETLPARGRASYTFRSTDATTGHVSTTEGHAPAPEGAGAARHQGAPDRAATEGGSQPGEGDEPSAAAATRTRPRLRQAVRRDQLRATRFTSDELHLVERAADTTGLTLSGFLADAAVAVARSEEGPASWLMDQRALVEELMRASAHLARVGNNLNQVARVLNSGGEAPYAQDALARVRRAAARVEAAATEIAKR
ncbi:plasmid mobilization relaxosome protein MobC [Streptomyces sp. Ru73]|uniref:plasmid mobilization protein n=1 Tax=Streptomyces sp. Ru73 TaxID=2080748 RepID=UPI000CDD9B74|nr:plasmid mobilization relaxosome protein MobC [Streptomyces sp. Ru73]POX43046.1 plasmid mobilization relaxosome protein MobC [Streptomyces sp. Ru73]